MSANDDDDSSHFSDLTGTRLINESDIVPVLFGDNESNEVTNNDDGVTDDADPIFTFTSENFVGFEYDRKKVGIKISGGSFSVVYKQIWQDSVYAIKVPKKDNKDSYLVVIRIFATC